MQSKMRARRKNILSFLLREHGQDLVEYALLIGLIAFGVTAGMKSMATRVSTVFTNFGTSLTSTIS